MVCEGDRTGGCVDLNLRIGGGRALTFVKFFGNSDANSRLKLGQIRQRYSFGPSGINVPPCYDYCLRACSRGWSGARGVISQFNLILWCFDLLVLLVLRVLGGVSPTVMNLFFPLGGILGAGICLGAAVTSALVCVVSALCLYVN